LIPRRMAPTASARALTAFALLAETASSAIPSPGAPPPAPPPSAAATPPEASTCKETFPAGSQRPKVTESFPDRGKSGYALVLDLVLEHGRGETVLPSGLGAHTSGDEAQALERAGFFLPNVKGTARPLLETKVEGERARSHLTIPVVALPKKPGRHELELPPLPVAIARASGEVRTLCTAPHKVIVEDPTANAPDAKPKGNPRPLRQLEEWTAAKNAAIGALIALLTGAVLAWLFSLWKKRPKPVVPPPPPRPPWDIALEELFDVRHARLVEQGRFAEHFDRVSDAVRRYLGARYGFDGLETTTREAMSALRRVTPRIGVLTDVEVFLENADLVKFAKLAPAEAECDAALGRAEELVRRTMPGSEEPPRAPPPTPEPPAGVPEERGLS
jgi:hypothetical protein